MVAQVAQTILEYIDCPGRVVNIFLSLRNRAQMVCQFCVSASLNAFFDIYRTPAIRQ